MVVCPCLEAICMYMTIIFKHDLPQNHLASRSQFISSQGEHTGLEPSQRPSVHLSTLSNLNIFATTRPFAIISSPEPSRRPSVRASVHPSTLSNLNISATTRLIAIKFYLKHHWGGGKGSIRFWARSDQNSGFHGNR